MSEPDGGSAFAQKKSMRFPVAKKRLLVVTVFLTTFLTTTGFAVYSDFFDIARNIELLGRVYRDVAANYVDEINVSEFMRAGIDGMLSTLDPYTVFMDEEQSDDIEQLTTGKYAGVGITISNRDNEIIVMSVTEGYSAEKAGVLIGDKIIEVNGQSLRGKRLDDVRKLIKGEPNTEVIITVEREREPKPIKFNLVRLEVAIKNVTYINLLDDGIGYVDIQRFSVKTADELGEAIESLQDSAKKKGGTLKGLILDLRDDPGGLLDVAVGVTGKFVPKGSTIVTTRGRDSLKIRTYASTSEPLLKDIPVAVLINNASASASEIVAGAIQDLDRGVVVGSRSFGKGLVQTITRLPYNTSLKITTAKYYTPSGRLIQEVDYFQRNKREGKRNVIQNASDTNRVAYKTKAGRVVYGGGGISPDVLVKERELSNLEKQLMRKSLFFKFANRFRSENPSLPKNFKVTDDLLVSFKRYLKEQKFEYEYETEQALNELSDKFSKQNYPDAARQKLKDLRASVLLEKEKDFDRQKDIILNELDQEIALRYDSERAKRVSFKYDAQFHEAVNVLKDSKRYQALLTVPAKKREAKATAN
ncbi:MAG: S41 family peptidase [Chlorobiales bacterium]|nr:S41 family peptidase [Chlorobiales bacterium]